MRPEQRLTGAFVVVPAHALRQSAARCMATAVWGRDARTLNVIRRRRRYCAAPSMRGSVSRICPFITASIQRNSSSYEP